MIWYTVHNKASSKEVVYYHIYDLEGEEIIPDIRYAKKADIGKFVKLDDGSDLYVRIDGVTNKVIKTNCGLYRRWDLVHVSHPRDPSTSVNGLRKPDVHPLVRQYTVQERRMVERIIQNPESEYNMTKRIKMLTLEKLQDRMKERHMDDNEIIDLIIDTARDKGIHFRWSMTLLMRAQGMDANDFVYSHMNKEIEEKKEVQRITTMPNGVKVIEKQTLPAKRDFKKVLTKVQVGEIVE